MLRIKFSILFLVILAISLQAQHEVSPSDNRSKVVINNDKGELSITFENNSIKEFIINDNPVDKNRYADYQAIIDEFNGEENIATIPSTPVPPEADASSSEELHQAIVDFLLKENVVSSPKKYKIHLEKSFLKVNGKSSSESIHQECLDLFEKFYGHTLNTQSEVKFKKSRGNTSASFKIRESD